MWTMCEIRMGVGCTLCVCVCVCICWMWAYLSELSLRERLRRLGHGQLVLSQWLRRSALLQGGEEGEEEGRGRRRGGEGEEEGRERWRGG